MTSLRTGRLLAWVGLALLVVALGPATQSVWATPLEQAPQVEVSADVQHDVSGPLRGRPSAPSAHKLTEHPLRILGYTAPQIRSLTP